MVNVYEQVSANKRNSFVIIFLFVAFIISAAFLINYAFNLDYLIPIAIIFSLFSSFFGYFYGDKIILTMHGAKEADRQHYFNYYTVVENLSIASQIPLPKTYIIDTPAPNAFATGRDPNHAIICITTGLLEKLNRTELEGVIAHEISHIKNFDIRLMMIVSILLGTLTILINMSWYSRRNSDNNEDKNNILALLGFFMIIFAPIIGQLIQLAISRRREFLADASAVKLTRQPDGLINALKKISSDRNIFATASTATSSLYISNPFKDNKITSLFSTHPPTKDRIKALEQMM